MARKKVISKKIGGGHKVSDDFSNTQIFAIIGLFVIGMFLLISLNISPEITGHAAQEVKIDFSGVLKIFQGDTSLGGWTQGALDPAIAKVLLWVMIALLIYGAFKFSEIPTKKGEFLKVLLSGIISFLAVAYITPQEIFAMMTGYTVLGLTLGVIAPFAVMILISAMLLAYDPKKGHFISVGKILLELMIWIFFVLTLTLKIITGYFTSINEIQKDPVILTVMLVVLALAVIIVLWNRQFRKWMAKIGMEIIEQRAETVGELMRANSTIQGKVLSGVNRTLGNDEDYSRYGV